MPESEKELIHIIPVGSKDPLSSYLAPFEKYPASKVIFLLGTNAERPDEKEARRIAADIAGALPAWIPHETVFTNIFNFTAVMKTLAGIIRAEKSRC